MRKKCVVACEYNSWVYVQVATMVYWLVCLPVAVPSVLVTISLYFVTSFLAQNAYRHVMRISDYFNGNSSHRLVISKAP